MYHISQTHSALSLPVLNSIRHGPLRQALARHRAGRLADAASLYRAMLRLQPNNAPVHYLYGVLLSHTDKAAALTHLQRAVELDQQQTGYWLSFIETLLVAEQRAYARHMLASASVVLAPSAALATLAAKIEQPSEARQQALIDVFAERNPLLSEIAARIFLNEYPQHPLGRDVLVQVLVANRSFDEAITLRRAYMIGTPQDVRGRLMLGRTLLQSNKCAEAIIELRMASAADVGNPEILTVLAAAEHGQGRIEQAEYHYREALAYAPDRLETLCNFGTFLAQTQRPEEAEASYRQALHYAPDHAASHSNLACLLQERGRLHEAQEFAERAIRLDPTMAEAHCNLGHVYRDLGRPADAARCYRRALALNPALEEAKHFGAAVASHANFG